MAKGKGKGKPKDDRNEEERMKRIMLAATGYETVEEARNKPSAGVGRDGKSISSAREFLEDMEGEVNEDLANAAGREIIAPDQKDDMKLNSVLIGGPAPKPPERRKVLHSDLAQSLSSSRFKASGADQSMNLMDPTMARRGHSNNKTSLTSRIFGGPTYDNMNDADPSKDADEYIRSKRHMVRYYNFICFLVVCILMITGSTLLAVTLMSSGAPEPIEQTTTDGGTKEISDFGSPTLAPVSVQTKAPTTSLLRFDEMMSKLVDTGFAEESQLRNGITAQSKALDWLAGHDPAALDPSSEDLLPRYVLAVLFYSTSGREPKLTSTIKTKWKQHKLWLSGSNYCEWYGIKCIGEDDYFVTDGTDGTIAQINLPENHLEGGVPSELVALSDLQSLNLKGNHLSGPIPAGFKFSAMKNIYFDYNNLNGTLDALRLEQMPELRTLSMPYNQLIGTIPASIGSANKLRYIKLGGNKLTGNFPATMANLTKLETLHVSRNKLNGAIPDHFFEMKRLVNVSMSQNLFEGKLSPKLSQLSHLQELHLTGNDFSGTVPDAFDGMVLLATLHLGENRLSGEVPKSLGSRHRLQKLDLTANEFVGTMPQEICELKETGKLYHLGADCVMNDGTALDASSLGDNRRRRLAEEPVRAGTSRLGGSFVDEEEPEDEDTEIVLGGPEEEEEVLNQGDFVFVEEDGTVEDKDGNVIEGVDMQDLEDPDDGKPKVRAGTSRLGGSFVDEEEPENEDEEIVVGGPEEEEEVLNQGDFVFVEEDGTVEDKDGNVIEGVDMQDLEDPDNGKPKVRAGTSRLGGSFVDEEDPENEDEEIVLGADLEVPEEEVIEKGDFVYLEEDGTVEDKDGNVIDLAVEELEDLDGDEDAKVPEEEDIDAGDFVYLEEDGTVEDKDGNIIDGVAMEDLEDLDADADGEEEEDEPELFMEPDGTVEDKDGNIVEGVALEDLEVVDEDEPELFVEPDGTVEDKDGNIVEGVALEDLEVIDEDGDEEEPELFIEEDGTVEDKDGNIIEGIALEDLEVVDEDPQDIQYTKSGQTVPLNSTPEDEDGEQVFEFTQPLITEKENITEKVKKREAKKPKIAYASQGVAFVQPPAEGTPFSGIDCPCCTFCLAASPSASDVQNGKSISMPTQEQQEPVGSPECISAIQEGNLTDGYSGLVGMDSRLAKKCLQDNTTVKNVIMVPASIRRHFNYDANRIIIFLDRDRNVKSAPKLG